MKVPRTKRGVAAYVFGVAFLTFSLFATANSPVHKNVLSPSPLPSLAQPAKTLGAQTENHHVMRVIDGDTFEIETSERVRMIGIDAPETVDPRKPVGCFGPEASAYAKAVLLGQDVILVKDLSNTDSFGRLLRYVYIGDNFINHEFVAKGFAFARSYPPDIKYQSELREAERNAFANSLGLWGPKCK